MDVMVASTVDLPQALNDPTQNLLRPAQMVEHTQEMASARKQLEDPRVPDKGEVRKRLQSLQRDYDRQAPRPITDGAMKDALAKESKELLERIVPKLLSQEEMRKNPAGSTDAYRRGEGSPQTKRDILRWKKLQVALNADHSDPHTWDRDAANLERYRPQGAQDRFRTDAQISGVMSYGSVPPENWEQTFGSTAPVNSALNQAKRVAEAQDATPRKK